MKHILLCISMSLFLVVSVQAQKTKILNPKTEKSKYELLGPTEFQLRMDKEPGVILDVRTPGEQKKGMIKGAKAMDIFSEHFDAQINGLDRNKTYYVYCAAGGRSLEACEKMQRMGFKHLVDLDGGFTRWKNEGGLIELK